ncbi:MAG: SUMF1/EgtB/PvdO family nonheme iron enzyme [Candidatus Cloacimonetes bacterium]|nr:SUMF1/EgtB/PvdO family nonheme iron enzyme [Candidatus Cloacimonadota bacterium]
MKKIAFFIICFLLFNMLQALGTLRVESIKENQPTDMNISVRDADGKWAAVLLVKTELRGLGFQNVSRPTLHAAEYEEGDHRYKFYMNDKQRVVKLTHADYEPLEVRLLADFSIEVKAQRVYELKLAFDKEVIQVPVVITCNQNGAEILVDGNNIGRTENRMLTANISSGMRTISLQKDGFAAQTRTEEISMQNNSFDFKLVPAMPAAVSINSNPQGAAVSIDGLKFGITPAQSFFDAGTYPIKIEKENYETIEEQITITKPETKKTYNLTDIRATLTVKTYPNATVKFNGNSYKGGVSNQKIAPQVLQISVEMPKAETINRVVTLKPKTSETLEIFPEVQTGTVQVMTIPTTASIELNGDGGEHYTATGRKTFVDVPIGTYELTAKADGYKTHTESFRLQADATATKQITLEKGSDVPDNMIFVNGGTFQMGSNEENDEKPIHSVTVSDFYIGKYEVTQKEWKAVMGSNPSNWKGDNLPVETVSWYDAVEFCNKKSEKEGLQKCYSGSGKNITCDFSKNGYRLPTEVEWEYAARGGNKSKGYKYSGSNNIGDVAWYNSNSGSKTHQVGTKQANELGIYDMSGNVWEWCWDWYGNYSSNSQTNPKGADSGSYRILRGGSWTGSGSGCRVANRVHSGPGDGYSYRGFRFLRTP